MGFITPALLPGHWRPAATSVFRANQPCFVSGQWSKIAVAFLPFDPLGFAAGRSGNHESVCLFANLRKHLQQNLLSHQNAAKHGVKTMQLHPYLQQDLYQELSPLYLIVWDCSRSGLKDPSIQPVVRAGSTTQPMPCPLKETAFPHFASSESGCVNIQIFVQEKGKLQ